MEYYTYLHSRADDGKVFYIGKGKERRAWAKNKRSLYWQRVVAKHGLKVDVLAYWPDELQAHEHERLLIACFRDLGYELANMTDGGEGSSGWRHDPATVEKIKASNRGRKRTPEAVANSRAARAKWLEQDIHKYWTPERRQEASKAVSGERHPNFGKRFSEGLRAKLSAAHKGHLNMGRSVPVQCLDTGEVFPSSSEAARHLQVSGKPKATGSAISMAARGVLGSAYGYRWGFA